MGSEDLERDLLPQHHLAIASVVRNCSREQHRSLPRVAVMEDDQLGSPRLATKTSSSDSLKGSIVSHVPVVEGRPNPPLAKIL